MSRYATCPFCGHRMRRVRDLGGFWDGETYQCDWCARENYDDDEDEDTETLSVDEAADIWASQGKDEDYMFGYSEEDLEKAL